MKQNATKLRMRRSAIWAVIAVAYCAIAVAIMIWIASPSSQDVASESQLIGRWGMWINQSDMDKPPERVMEYLPGGKSDSYTPGFERKVPEADIKQNWFVRNGVLIWRVRTADTRKTVEFRHKFEWIDSDYLRLTFDGVDGKPATIYCRRLNEKPDEIPRSDERSDVTELSSLPEK